MLPSSPRQKPNHTLPQPSRCLPLRPPQIPPSDHTPLSKEAVYVTTGAVISDGYDAVVPLEQVRVLSTATNTYVSTVGYGRWGATCPPTPRCFPRGGRWSRCTWGCCDSAGWRRCTCGKRPIPDDTLTHLSDVPVSNLPFDETMSRIASTPWRQRHPFHPQPCRPTYGGWVPMMSFSRWYLP